MVVGPGHSPRGRRKGHELKPWQFLEQYAEWDEAEAAAWRFERDKTPFYSYLPISFGSGERCLNDYGFPWPPVPRYDELNRPVLVYLIHGHPPFPVLFVSNTLCERLDLARVDVLGRPAMDCLRPGEDLKHAEPEHVALALALARGDVPDNMAVIADTHLVHANGLWLPVELRLRYGKTSEAYYVQAIVTGPLYERPRRTDGQTEWVSLDFPALSLPSMNTVYDDDGEPIHTTFEFNAETSPRITRKLLDDWKRRAE